MQHLGLFVINALNQQQPHCMDALSVVITTMVVPGSLNATQSGQCSSGRREQRSKYFSQRTKILYSYFFPSDQSSLRPDLARLTHLTSAMWSKLQS